MADVEIEFDVEWPLARAVDTPWFLRADGYLSRSAPAANESHDSFIYDPNDPVPTRGGAPAMSVDFAAGQFDQTPVEGRPDVLVYTSESLAEDIEVTGPVRVTLYAATNGPSTDWVARLCDVDAHGVSRNITDGSCASPLRPTPSGST
jgi:putative CocE/NonD family hydrolase